MKVDIVYRCGRCDAELQVSYPIQMEAGITKTMITMTARKEGWYIGDLGCKCRECIAKPWNYLVKEKENNRYLKAMVPGSSPKFTDDKSQAKTFEYERIAEDAARRAKKATGKDYSVEAI